MDENQTTDKRIEFYNQDSNDIIGRNSSALKIGYFVSVLLVFIGIICACLYVKCPDVIKIPIKITCTNPPVDAFAPTTGMIQEILVMDGDTVKKDAPILFLKSLNGTQYMVTSPADGIVNYMEMQHCNQMVGENSVLFNIAPKEVTGYEGRALVSAADVARFDKNCPCIIALNKYNEVDYGNVHAVISKINKRPYSNDMYMVNVDFPEGLKTDINKALPDEWYLTGELSIIVKDRDILDLVSQPIKRMVMGQP